MQERIKISDKLSVPRVLIGLWQIADMEKDGKTLDPNITSKYMNLYAENGFTSFDMADHYGSSEIIAGVFKNNYQNNSDINLFTKWVPTPGKIDRKLTKDAVLKSLSRMNQSQIDLMQFHAWQYSDPSWIDALFYLDELRREGLIKNIGVTNFDSAHLRIALSSGIKLVSNQICYSLLDRRASGEMSKICQKFGIKLFAFGTLAGGFLSKKWLGKKEPKISDDLNWSQMKYKRFIDVTGGWKKFQNLLETLDELAIKNNTSISNISSRYILEDPNVAAVIIGARLGESDHINDNKKIYDISQDPLNLRQKAGKKAQENADAYAKAKGWVGRSMASQQDVRDAYHQAIRDAGYHGVFNSSHNDTMSNVVGMFEEMKPEAEYDMHQNDFKETSAKDHHAHERNVTEAESYEHNNPKFLASLNSKFSE